MAAIPDVIQAKAFQLVDDGGNVSAELKTSNLGTPAFALRDQGGNIRLMGSLDENGEPSLILYNQSSELRLFAALDEAGGPVLVLFDGHYRKMTTAESYEKRPFRQSQMDAWAAKQEASSKGEETPRKRWWKF